MKREVILYENDKNAKKILSIILAVLLVVSAGVTAFAADGELTVNAEAKPAFITSTGGIYAHAQAGSDSAQARLLIEEYIDYYNNHRIQTKTKLTPLEKRCQYVA